MLPAPAGAWGGAERDLIKDPTHLGNPVAGPYNVPGLWLASRKLGCCRVGKPNADVSNARVQSTAWCCCNPVTRSLYSAVVGGAGGHLPSVTIEYCGVEIEADAQIGKDAVPSLTKALWNFLKVILSDTDAQWPSKIPKSKIPKLMSHGVIEHSWERKPCGCLC